MKGVTGLPSPYELSVWMMAPAYNLLMEWLHQKTTDETQILWGGPVGYLAQYAGSTCQRTLWMCSCRCPHNPVQQDCRTSRHICAQFFPNPNCSVTAAAVWLCDVKIDTWHHINHEDQNTYSSRAKASHTSFLRALHLSGKTKTVASFFYPSNHTVHLMFILYWLATTPVQTTLRDLIIIYLFTVNTFELFCPLLLHDKSRVFFFQLFLAWC